MIVKKKCEHPDCDHEFPEHYFSDYCSDHDNRDCPTCARGTRCRCQKEIEEIRWMNDPAIEFEGEEKTQ